MQSVATPANRPLVIACGALANDLQAALAQLDAASAVDVHYLPARLHNRPEGIVPAVEAELATAGGRPVFVAYADCGTGGALDALLARHPGVSRMPGAHCFELYAGAERFAEMHDDEPGTFYLTDFLARHFDSLVWKALGIDRHPELRDMYFGNYTRVVWLAQHDDAAVRDAAEAAAERLGLAFEVEIVGEHRLADAVAVGLPRRETA